jgi:hypothetical protein
MNHAPRFISLLASVGLLLVACGGSGQAASPAPPPVSLELLHGNALPTIAESMSIVNGVATVTVSRRTLQPVSQWKTTRRTVRLSASPRRRLSADVQRADAPSFKVGAACGGLPVGDVGGWALKVGRFSTDCAPASAQPLLHLLESFFPRS